jgi:hypothetical protein
LKLTAWQQRPGFKLIVMSAGQFNTGATKSATNTLKEQLAAAELSQVEAVTTVLPGGKEEPEGTSTSIGTVQAPCTVKLTTAAQTPGSVLTEMSAGQASGVVQGPQRLKAQIAVPPAEGPGQVLLPPPPWVAFKQLPKTA